MLSLVQQVEQLNAAAPAIRAAIRRNDAHCWDAQIQTVLLRFHSNAGSRREDFERLRDAVDELIRYATARDALNCLMTLHEQGCCFSHLKRPSGPSLVHEAARRGAERVLAWLLDTQALDFGSENAWALHYACEGGHRKIVRALLARHFFVDPPNSRGETPLHTALYKGHQEIVQDLVAAGANLGATTTYGDTPLAIAARNERWALVLLLLDRGASLTRALPVLLGSNIEQITHHPRVRDAQLRLSDEHEVGRVFQSATPEQAKALLSRGANPAVAAVYALRNDNHDLLSIVRQHAPFRYTSAHYRSAVGSIRGLRQLLDQGGDPNALVEHEHTNERHPLIFYAVMAPWPPMAIIELLLERGAYSVAPPELKTAPLIIHIVLSGRATPEVIAKYAACGHNVDQRGSEGKTALHVLASLHWNDSVRLTLSQLLSALIRAGADLDARDDWGRTPLMYSVRAHSTEGLHGPTALLDAGADIKLSDHDGFTVLHHLFEAAKPSAGHHPLLHTLVSRGADVGATSADGRLPEEIGDIRNCTDLRNSLRRLRGRPNLVHRSSAKLKTPTRSF